MTAPLFSIVVPAYQAESTLGETLDAILAQKFRDWECIVVDDGSADDTLRIATGYAEADPRIRAVHQENQGTAGAYNTGVSSATGDFIVICSADDLLLPDHLVRMAAFVASEPGYDIYSSNGYLWWPPDYRELFYGSRYRQVVHSLDLCDVIHRCFYSVGAVYRRGLFAAVGGYRLGVFGEDYDFWLRAMAAGARHRYLPEALSLYRMSASQKSASVESGLRSNLALLSDLRRDFELSPREDSAMAERIRELETQLARNRRLRTKLRRRGQQLVVRVLGPRRGNRISREVKSMILFAAGGRASGEERDDVLEAGSGR